MVALGGDNTLDLQSSQEMKGFFFQRKIFFSLFNLHCGRLLLEQLHKFEFKYA